MIYTHVTAAMALILAIVGQVHAAPKPSAAGQTRQLMPRVDCTTLQGCSNCVSKGCGFSKTAFTCLPASTSPTSNQVRIITGCPQMDQQQGVFPAVNSVSKAGIISSAVLKEWNRIMSHIFNGETTSKTSGRHTSTAWLSANPGSVLLETNANTHILKYRNGAPGKTVWDSNFYSNLDIENMCAVTIQLGNNKGVLEGAFVVQTPFGSPACINHFSKGTGSCYPLGTAAPTQALGTSCDVPGENDQD